MCSITCIFPYSHRICETLTNRKGTCAGNSFPPCSLTGASIPTVQLLSLWTEEGVFLLLNDKLQDQAAIIFIRKSESAICHYRPPLLQQKIDNHLFLFICQEMHMSPAAKKVSLAIRNDLLRSLNDSGAWKKAISLRQKIPRTSWSCRTRAGRSPHLPTCRNHILTPAGCSQHFSQGAR